MTSRASWSVTLRRCFGSNRSTAKPQKSHLALQMLVMANCRYPGPPWSSTSLNSRNTLRAGRTTGWEKSAGFAEGAGEAGGGWITVAVLIQSTVFCRTNNAWQYFFRYKKGLFAPEGCGKVGQRA